MRIISTIKRDASVTDSMSYIILKCHRCDIDLLKIHCPTKDKTDDMKGSFQEKLESAFNKFLKYSTKIVLGDNNVGGDREDVLNRQLEMKVYTKSVTITELC
jgi:exonuclease III